MATERTVMAPDGVVTTFDVADQTVMTPSGFVINATIEAAAAGVTPSPWGHQRLDNQYAAIAAHRLNGVLQ